MSVDIHRTRNNGLTALVDASKTIPVLVEPALAEEREASVARMGDRCGRVGAWCAADSRTDLQNVAGDVPPKQVVGYASGLRSATQGRATFSMNFDHYVPVQSAISKEIVHRARRF